MRRIRGTAASALLTVVVVQPIGCGSEDTGEISDGGGCNGGRTLPSGDEEGTSETGMTDPETSESTQVSGVCGDGVVDDGEACDDANTVDEDGCPSGAVGQCKAEATCGDGITHEGAEACDDGNDVNGDGCEQDCSLTPVATCGNGDVEVGEACDDGNTVETDECPSGPEGKCAALASCGDGFVQDGVEGCDDGNDSETDECPSGASGQCIAVASCGDGFVQDGVEVCDDANAVEEDECPSGPAGQCTAAASCGDGFVWQGTEACDDGNEEDTDDCNNDCTPPRWAFISSTNSKGGLGGIPGADSICQSLADAADLEGTYMAWLTGSDDGSAPATRFASTEFVGWYRLPTDPPTPIARGWQELVSPTDDIPTNYLEAAIVADEHGLDMGDATAWTNTTASGTRAGDDHCLVWSEPSGDENGQTGRSKVDILGEEWTANGSFPCNLSAQLYCFQIG